MGCERWWGWPAGGVDVVNIGSEDLYVDNIYITGSTDFLMPDPSAGYGLPIPLAPGDCCTSTNGVFFPLEFQPISGPTYTFRLEETNTLTPGDGSIVVPAGLSTMMVTNRQTEIFLNTMAWLASMSEMDVAFLDVNDSMA